MENKLPNIELILHQIDMHAIEMNLVNTEVKEDWWESQISRLSTPLDLGIFIGAVPNAITRMLNQSDGNRIGSELQAKIIDLAILLNGLNDEINTRNMAVDKLLDGTGTKLK